MYKDPVENEHLRVLSKREVIEALSCNDNFF